uniref:Fibronectin type-III domain-containing protein n=1 Tax=Ditylenchus dipsaci TaxID=166011 RepID=A0A915E012_9BILA
MTDPKAPTRNPNGVRVEGSQPDNLIVYWNAMPREEWNREDFSYQVQYRPKDDSEWKSIQVDDPFAEKLTIDLGDRHPWEPYEVQVRAKNKLGESLVAPETDITATTADFFWDAVDPSKVQGNFTGYKITYWFDDDETQLEEEVDFKEARQKRHYSRSLVRRHLSSNSALNRKSVIFAPTATSGTIAGLKPNSLNYAIISVLNGQNEGALQNPSHLGLRKEYRPKCVVYRPIHEQ